MRKYEKIIDYIDTRKTPFTTRQISDYVGCPLSTVNSILSKIGKDLVRVIEKSTKRGKPSLYFKTAEWDKEEALTRCRTGAKLQKDNKHFAVQPSADFRSKPRDPTETEAKRRIHGLVEDYLHILVSGQKEQLNEERTKFAFVVPLLEALGWEVTEDELSRPLTLSEKTISGIKVGIFVEAINPNESLDGYEVTKVSVRNYAMLAIQHARQLEAAWTILTNFEETRLYNNHAREPADGLIWSMRFTEYESRIDELWSVSRQSVHSGVLMSETKAYRPLEYDQVTKILKEVGPLTRAEILEKLSLHPSYEFPWYVREFGSRKRKLYYLDGQEAMVRKMYENILKPPPKPPSLTYPKEYFLNLLNLKRTASRYRAADGTPTWWERRANRQYTCSVCKRSIRKGARYIGRSRLIPGMRGIYGYKGKYVKEHYHITCLLAAEEVNIQEAIESARLGIGKLVSQIAAFEEEIVSRRKQIEERELIVRNARKDYEKASFWRKLDKWFGHRYTSWSRVKEISHLRNRMDVIEETEIPDRQSNIVELKRKISSLNSRLGPIQRRKEELLSLTTN